MLSSRDTDLHGLIEAIHWSPTAFTFRDDEPTFFLVSLTGLPWPDHRAHLEPWRYEASGEPFPAHNVSNRSELYVEPQALTSAGLFNDILAEPAAIAHELEAKQIQLPCPCDIRTDSEEVDVVDQRLAFAGMRKRL